MKKFVLVLGWLVSLVLVAGVASNAALKNQRAAFNVPLRETQAMLAFNHMVTFRELEGFLEKGCYAEALEKVKISKNTELSLLASFFKDYPNTSTNKYVSDRDPKLIEQLQSFKNPYGTSWYEPTCSK